jgi:esterase
MAIESSPVPLSVQAQGTAGECVVILHGLLGSARNWRSVSSVFAKDRRVYALDLRNHGNSPHTGAFTVDDLAGDVEAWMKANLHDGPTNVVGHSLGGKTAMKLACHRPDLVRRLVVVDITSEPAPRRWGAVFDAMLGIDLLTLRDRKSAEDQLEAAGVSDWPMRKFLASNLEQDNGGAWHWKIGLAALSESALQIVSGFLDPTERYEGPVLLIRGELSEYAPLADLPAMRTHLPNLRVETIPNAGHNVHIDAPHAFIDALRGFLNA